MMKKIIALLLALVLTFSFAACNSSENTDQGQDDTESLPTEEINVGFLNGPTGIGAAQLMSESEAGNLALNYNFTVESDPQNINSALINGDLSIAAVPTNVASTLYNKTDGKIKIIAINTMGVLHILENGNTINSIADLEGKTIYATGQASNPEYVLNYILTKNGLEPGEDVTIEYLASDELTTKMAAGEVSICMLPVPAATTVLMKNSDVRDAINLTDEWEKVSDSQLTQGCIVARTDLVSDAVIKQFLTEYSASIAYMSNEENLEAAAELTVKYGIVGNAEIAKLAIPQSGLVCITGSADMKATLGEYFQVLFDAAPDSIGGTLPDDAIYYEVQ